MGNKKKPDYGLIAFYFGLIFLIFLAGGYFGEKNIAPYRWLSNGFIAFRVVKTELQANRPASSTTPLRACWPCPMVRSSSPSTIWASLNMTAAAM
jgi:hypothetical protein